MSKKIIEVGALVGPTIAVGWDNAMMPMYLDPLSSQVYHLGHSEIADINMSCIGS